MKKNKKFIFFTYPPHAKIAFAIAGGAATLSSAAVLGVKTTGEIIVHIIINYYSINYEGRIRYRNVSPPSIERKMKTEISRKSINNLLKKVITWIPKL